MKSCGSHRPPISSLSMTPSHPEHLHHHVAEVVDHLHCDASALRALERAPGVGIKRRPGILVDLGLKRRPQALVRVVGAEKVGVADEEALLVVVDVDEPGGDPARVVRADVAGVGIEHIDSTHLHTDFRAAVVEDFDVGLTEDDEHVAASGVLQLLPHVHVGVDPRLEDFEAAEAPEFRRMSVEVEGAGDEDVEARVHRFARRGDDVLLPDSSVFRPDEDRGPALGTILAFDEDSARADEGTGPRCQALEDDAVALRLLLDALGPEIVDCIIRPELQRRRLR